MEQSPRTSSEVIVVGFADAARSASALRWAIDRSRATGSLLRVVHASSFPLTTHNAPSASVAQQLGNPSWAALHSTVAAFNPPAELHTVADQGTPLRVLLRWSQDASLVVLGEPTARPWRRSTRHRLQTRLDIPVVEITDRSFALRRDPSTSDEIERSTEAENPRDGKVSS